MKNSERVEDLSKCAMTSRSSGGGAAERNMTAPNSDEKISSRLNRSRLRSQAAGGSILE